VGLIMVPIRAAWIFSIAWIFLLLSAIPIVLDYVEHIHAQPWAWYALVFPLCVFSSLSRTERRAPRVILAFVLVLFGIVWEIIASASGMLRLGRPGFLLATAGILAADGRLDLRRFVIMALAIPIPYAVIKRIGEPLLFLNLETLTRTLHAFGVPAIVTAYGVERPTGLVTFEAIDAGWTSAIFAFGLAWVLFEHHGRSWGRTLIVSGIAAVAGFVVHLLCTTALFALVEPASLADTRIWRDALSYCVIAAGTGAYCGQFSRRFGASAAAKS
jgi:hypothetical protein